MVFGTPLWFGVGEQLTLLQKKSNRADQCTAHAHHAWDNFKRNGGNADAAKRAIATSRTYHARPTEGVDLTTPPVFQLSYTTLFGWFAAYLYLRTGEFASCLASVCLVISDYAAIGSVIAPAASHIFCNYMGIYLPSTATQRHPTRSLCE